VLYIYIRCGVCGGVRVACPLNTTLSPYLPPPPPKTLNISWCEGMQTCFPSPECVLDSYIVCLPIVSRAEGKEDVL